MKGKGFFICVEGLDGCGKTTQARMLVKNLKRRGFDALYTAEPSRGKIGKFIRKHFLNVEKRASGVVEALLFAADRFEHLEYEVKPALNMGKIVVSDRYVYSSLAYQGAAGLDLKWIRKVNMYALTPNLAIFIDVQPETVFKRLKPKKSVMEKIETQRKVREYYMKFVKKGDLVKVNGNRSKAEVAEEILSIATSHLQNP
jgi:dTMP kinase